jgi:hypothetical protein
MRLAERLVDARSSEVAYPLSTTDNMDRKESQMKSPLLRSSSFTLLAAVLLAALLAPDPAAWHET